MYAVIETGGKQYRVAPGDIVEVETLPGEVGTAVQFDKVLAVVNEGAVSAGLDAATAKVTGVITGHDRGDKVIVFKFKRKKQYRRTIGHRQNFTRVRVESIEA